MGMLLFLGANSLNSLEGGTGGFCVAAGGGWAGVVREKRAERN